MHFIVKKFLIVKKPKKSVVWEGGGYKILKIEKEDITKIGFGIQLPPQVPLEASRGEAASIQKKVRIIGRVFIY